MNASPALFQVRYALLTWPAILFLPLVGLSFLVPSWRWVFLALAGVALTLALLGLRDITQKRHAVLRNYPVAARLRFLFEGIRPRDPAVFL